MSGGKNIEPNSALLAQASALLVTRSNVPHGLPYKDYRGYLRTDFYYSCAYCTISESEALAIRFCIDHYEPRKVRPELENAYSNLMYACFQCNTLKGDRCPSQEIRDRGYRFFRPDADVYEDHFRNKDRLLEPKSDIGYFTIEFLDLNRQSLRRLREIRTRLANCDKWVAEGVLGLRGFPIDRLPPHIKGSAAKMIRRMDRLAHDLAEDIDELLRRHAKSDLVDSDPDAKQRAVERAIKAKHLTGLQPGAWQAARGTPPRKGRRHKRS